MSKRLAVFVAAVMCIAVLSAQRLDRTVALSIAEYFNEYTSDRCVTKFANLDRRRNNIVVNRRAQEITIYCNDAFYAQPFTPDMVKRVYDDIRNLLPKKYKKYKIRVLCNGNPIDKCIPNIYRNKKSIDESRLWGDIEYVGEPWVCNESRPFRAKYGLEGRHLAVGQSHGKYYSVSDSLWKWQRPSLFCTIEDLFTQSIVLPFLVPMLENAGALIYTPRERDWQPNSVIADNDKCRGDARYSEQNGKKNVWKRDSVGYAPLKELYFDGDNPFAMGTSRIIEATAKGSRVEAAAMWYISVPVDGEYAVYVAYRTYENSVPDACYTVTHAGGSTIYKVNQTMGGGTWVYLGTHFFNADEKQQGVTLSSVSEHKGVVSADAVRFGGGMGDVARGDSVPQTSGVPRYLEGARYNLQTGGFPVEVYSTYKGENDYRDDINSRSHALNYLSGGSVYNPDTVGLNVPIELSFSFHSDAGYSMGDSIVGSLGVVTAEYECDTLAAGCSRYMSRDLATYLLHNLQDDLYNSLGMQWQVRGILDRNYSESRIPCVPSVIFESLSHQNFADLQYGLDPNFKFVMARSVYKSLLKHLAYVHGKKCVVQPLPVRNFSTRLSKDGTSAHLRWAPVDDSLEPTAKAKGYVVYTRVDDGGFDNGVVVKEPHYDVVIEKNKLYSFKVVALNDGGCSMPSEVLSLYVPAKPSKRVLVVNGFHRLDAPHSVVTEKRVGFDMDIDPGVAYIRTPEFCGNQLDLLRENIGYEDGLGLSGSEMEGKLIAGNTFDYPSVHGKALAVNGIGFVSCSSDAVMAGDIDMDDYDAVDLILGVEKQGGSGVGIGYNGLYKTFPHKLQNKIRAYCRGGGKLFVSGAYIASDMYADERDRDFLRDVLRLDYGGMVYDASENIIWGSGLDLPVCRRANERCYAVPYSDVLVPINDAFVSFIYKGNRKSAGVAYSGTYRVLSTAFPFEAVACEEGRAKLMGAIMRFLLE